MARVDNLGEAVEFSQTETHLVLKVMKLKQPAKEYALQAKGERPDGTKIWEVPGSYIYAYYKCVLADGSILTCMRRKDAPYAAQLVLYEKGIRAGLDVRPLGEEKKKSKKQPMTAEELDRLAALRESAKSETDENTL